ncbi:hypothetical protein PUR71_13100 [Streptomyces sp. SP17BM10]|uniref:hypothetical protein n=1 Tax=Streptomyces sp. SP17BM10 TaxID=3002530 RepID=UPI002E794ECA|nr:hypothetical protein [Streptomyces sp. SP17BM10]MEE1783837.1 hypothetical protein [Streptomyces sp. SP17BM10]
MNRARPTRHALRAACTLAAAALACAAASPAHADAPTGVTERVTVAAPGSQPNGASSAQGLSADGRFAVFTSSASNLLADNGNGNSRTKVFVRDLWTGKVEREDVSTTGADADLDSYEATISGNGRFVAFTSFATNLGSGAGGAIPNVYVHDRLTGRTEPVAATDPAKPQTGHSAGTPSISRDGRYVAFQSDRTDLAPAGVTPHGGTIYVTDRRTGKTRPVSIGADGTAADGSSASPVISADGRRVGFVSKATNLIARDEPGALAPDAFAGRTTDGTAGDDLPPAGGGRPRLLKPRSYPFYVRSLDDGETRLASPDVRGGALGAENASLSPDGRFAVFSTPVHHGPGPWDRHFEVYVHDLEEGTTRSVTVGLPGTTVRSDAWEGRMTADDRWVYFSSTADNLVPGDTNNASDVFRFDVRSGRTERVSVATDGSQTPGASYGPFVDAFGTTVLFTSDDGTLVPDDSNKLADVFVRKHAF